MHPAMLGVTPAALWTVKNSYNRVDTVDTFLCVLHGPRLPPHWQSPVSHGPESSLARVPLLPPDA